MNASFAAPSGAFRNRNVVITILFNFLDGACFSVWSAQLFPVLVNKLSGDTAVGWCAAASGVAQVCGALVAGYAADRLRREEVIRTAAFCGMAAVAATLVAVQLLVMPALYITQCVWGVYLAFASTSSEALFADSVTSGHRAFIYTFKWIVQMVCYCVGYVVTLVMLFLLGNEWSISSLQLVMTVGLAVHPVAQVLLLLLRDKYALSHTEMTFAINEEDENAVKKQSKRAKNYHALEAPLLNEERQEEDEKGQQQQETEGTHRKEGSLDPYENANEIDNDISASADESGAEGVIASNDGNNSYSILRGFRFLFTWNAIPYVVCFTDSWTSIGSGMTMQYLSLFFVNDYNIAPTLLIGAYIIISCGSAFFAALLRYIGEHHIGRLPAVIAVRTVGTTLMLLLALARGPWAKLSVVLTLFIIRSSCMNSTMGITRSVVMDCVKKSNRAKWSALESFSSFTWAGSATIGGYMAEARGYQFAFTVTAIVHYIGIVVLLPAAIGAHEMEKRMRARKQLSRQVQSRSRAKSLATASLQTENTAKDDRIQ